MTTTENGSGSMTGRRAIEDANARLHVAGLPNVTDLLSALRGVLENGGDIHENGCKLFDFDDPKPRCTCKVGIARAAIAAYRDVA
ncbi:hypothetical protein [Paraburkholderia sp. SIMBA_027]|uniref:hypothetical protein n=1 Tax=Paraburkholderia sp. SIMBA_027 TaxID=3085770 RepID=UPI00397CB8E0